MTRTTHLRTGITGLAVAAALATSAPAGADTTDLRTPDARDAASRPHATSSWQPGPDLRTPDSRDAADAPVVSVEAPGLTAHRIVAGGFQWDDAAIGAGGTLGFVVVLAGGAAAISRRRRNGGPLATS